MQAREIWRSVPVTDPAHTSFLLYLPACSILENCWTELLRLKVSILPSFSLISCTLELDRVPLYFVEAFIGVGSFKDDFCGLCPKEVLSFPSSSLLFSTLSFFSFFFVFDFPAFYRPISLDFRSGSSNANSSLLLLCGVSSGVFCCYVSFNFSSSRKGRAALTSRFDWHFLSKSRLF